MSVAKSPFGACQIVAPSMKPLPERLKNIVALSVIQKAVWSISGFWPKTIVRSAQKHGARPIFGSRPNIWFLKPPESRFQPFLVPDPKLLPEGLQNMARELFLDLDRIFGVWNLQKSFLKPFWFLAQNYYQNRSKSLRFEAFLVPSPKLLPERLKNIAR